MHPMFVTLFIHTDADDLLSEEHERKRHAHAARRGRSARAAVAARATITGQRPVLDVLAEDPDISKYLGRTALGELLDPRQYVGLSASMTGRALARNSRGT